MNDEWIFLRRAMVLAAVFLVVPQMVGILHAQFRTESATPSASTVAIAPPIFQNSLIAGYALTNSVSGTGTVTVPFGAQKSSSSDPGHKSPFLAAMLSLALPGLGEVYVGDDIWRGLVFTGLEAGLWIEMLHWNNRGNDSTAAFQNFSNAHFSTCRYADTLDTVAARLGVSDSLLANCSVASINRMERLIDSLYANDPNGDIYGHQLIDPTQNSQQYFEMISKYDQYLPGWDNLANYNQASRSRAEFNTEYDVGYLFLYGIILNHVLSAIDAALLARDHNTALRLHGDVITQPLPNGTLGYIPAAKIEYKF
jgi:hypothetical protein